MNKEERFLKFKLEHKGFFYEKRFEKHPKILVKKWKNENVKRWIKNNPERRKAHNVVFSAIRNKTLIKKPCFCGENKSEAHHEDYSQPLKVKWLCKKHHTEADIKRRLHFNKLSTDKDLRMRIRYDKVYSMKKDIKKDNPVRTFWLVTEAQKEKVAGLAKKRGISKSEVIRNLINKA